MSTEVEAFLGPLEALRAWKDQLQSVLVFALPSNLGLVPATGTLLRELRAHFEAPSAPDEEIAERWGREASQGSKVAYYTAFEFGDEGDETAVVWRDRQEICRTSSLDQAIELLGARAAGVGIDRYKKTHLWAAAAILQEFETRAGRAGIIEALNHPSEYVRKLAADQLGRSWPDQEVAIPALFDMARNDLTYGGRLRAASALGQMGPAAVPALKALLAPGVLKDRWGAIFTLGQMGPSASPAIPELVHIMQTEPDRNQRLAAAEALGKIGEAAAPAIPALIAALHDEDDHVRYHAVVALGSMGPVAAQALPAVRQALQDPYSEIPWVAIISLGQIGPFPLAEVIAALKSAVSWTVRCAAAKALGQAGPEAHAAIPAMIDALSDKDYLVRSNAAEALGLMGAVAKDALPALHKALEDHYVRVAATRSIEQIQSSAGSGETHS